MAEITAQAVKQLRELTDLPMMDCKKALTEAGGDQEKAIEILRNNVGKLKLKRAENVTTEGVIRILIAADGKSGAMVELQCESPPVAGAPDFLFLADQAAKLVLAKTAATTEEVLKSVCPDKPGVTFGDQLEETFNRIREKMVLGRVIRVEGPVGGYVHHDGKTGVLFRASGAKADAPVLRDVAMHIAALRPTVTTPAELPTELVSAERTRLTEEGTKSGKPANIVEKIVDGRMKTFYVEQGVLTEQPFAKEDSKSVSQALAEHGLKAEGFTRWVIGN